MDNDNKFLQVAAATGVGVAVLLGGPLTGAIAIGALAYRVFARDPQPEPKKSN